MTRARVLDPDVLASLGGLAVRVNAVVEGTLAGLHRSPFRGSSSEFAEHKEYTAGDELRTIDWKLVGRTDRYYVKQFHEETNLAAHLVLDTSASMGYGAPLSKHDYACVLAGTLAYLLAGQVDLVGLGFAHPEGPQVTPARSGRVHTQNVLDTLQAAEPGEGTSDLADTLDRIGEKIRRRGLVFIFSDLLVESEAVLAALNRLRSRPAQIVLIHILSPEELNFPFREASRFRDPEDAAQEVMADPESVRAAYHAQLRTFLDHWHDESLARNIRYH